MVAVASYGIGVSDVKKEIADRWIAALRSGRYEKGTNNLLSFRLDVQNNEQVVLHCALGVLCEVAVEDGVIKRHDEPGINPNSIYLVDEGDYYENFSHGAYVDIYYSDDTLLEVNADHAGYSQVLPDCLLQWADLTYNDGRTASDRPISWFNDETDMNFHAIALWIENVWEMM